MSKQIATFHGKYEASHNPATQTSIYEDVDMHVTSFWGGFDRGSCIQFTIQTAKGIEYIQMTKRDVQRMIDVMTEWTKGRT